MEICNARIRDTMLGFEGHGILTCCLTIEWDSSAQGFGLHDMGVNDEDLGRWVRGICKAFMVDDWESIKGKYCRIKRDDGRIVAIGHIVENKWFEAQRS